MIAKRIAGTNRTLGAPPGWNEKRDGKCLALDCRLSHDGGGVLRSESAWEPTPEEGPVEEALVDAG